jgi:hypothetical protein
VGTVCSSPPSKLRGDDIPHPNPSPEGEGPFDILLRCDGGKLIIGQHIEACQLDVQAQ